VASRRTFNNVFRQTVQLEIANQAVVTSIRLRKMNVEGSAPSERKEKTAHRVRAGDVGARAALGSFVTLAPLIEKFVVTFPTKPRNIKLRIGWKECLLFSSHIC
jgi:hypothetical protein